MKLAGKFAIVTGGSEGLGLAMVEALAREGADLCIVGRNAGKLSDAARQFDGSMKLSVSADLATDQGIDKVFEEVCKSSDESAWDTGSIFAIDGGLTAG